MPHAPALIVGAGPAGTAAAIMLARAGMAPRLIDRQAGPHDGVCGGFLGWDALAALQELGIDALSLGAQPIGRLRLLTGKHRVELALPHQAAGLSRRLLDELLIDRARDAGTVLMRGRAVRTADPSRRSVRLDDGEEWTGESLFLATGKHELRGLTRDLAGRREPPSVGLRTLLAASPARTRDLAGVIELHLFDQGYAGLLLQEDGTVNLCLSVARDRLSAAGGVPALMARIMTEAPCLADRMEGEQPRHFEAIAGVPYGWRAAAGPAGLFRIGDQGAVIASLAGDGIAMALASGTSAAQAFLTGGAQASTAWQSRWQSRSRLPIRVAEAFRHGAAKARTRESLMRLLQWIPGLGAQVALLTRAPAPRRGERRSDARSAPGRA
ncbi:oxidoreductase [Sphingobium lactosutens]|uniref:NAD(P)/FAD-dependent oxidoreductase n=1 Tax=Sphingobium lactosutens TaxID=522773 RepID=UPI0015BB401F|nr:FAD-dependent monooxygenase [Sphingobium lactosutens]NWK98883.1 oxidoreductase [Sphingobium lactosutens]